MKRSKVLLHSLLLTILVFALGIIINHALDYVRIGTIVDVMQVHELDSDAYQVESLFAEVFESNKCEAMASRISELKKEMRKVGEDLGTYSRFSFFKRKDFDYLKRRYFLLQLRFFSLIQQVNSECSHPYIPVLFFYEIDQDASERQGFILQELSESYDDTLVVLSLDIDYEDEPLVGLLAKYYNISEAPAIVVDGEVIEGLTYSGVLNSTIWKTMRAPDPYGSNYDFDFTVRAAGINKSRLLNQLTGILHNESADLFARGDAGLVLGRLTGNDTLICDSLDFFDMINSSDSEKMAVVYETSASIGCGRNRKAFYRAAAEEWRKAGNEFRADLDRALATGYVPEFEFDDAAIYANYTVISNYSSPLVPKTIVVNESVLIGSTGFVFDNNSTFLTQVDRSYRDWLSGQLQDPFYAPLLVAFSERLSYNDSELRKDVGWHEGGRARDLVRKGFGHEVGSGILVAKKDDRWFAVDDNGVFRFEVPLDKLLYPTTRFLHEDLAVIIDAHGINMLVEPAMRKNVSFVMGCCDHPGKVYAAGYLSEHNISVVCLTDKYVYTALGHDFSIVGSPPFRFFDDKVKIGGRPMLISKQDIVVATNASDDVYALWYYQTPASYFSLFDGLSVDYVKIDDFGQMNRVVERARVINASVIAARVFDSGDYRELKSWLEEDMNHKAVLFHSASYPYGQLLLREFELQATFDDPNPVVS